MEPTDFATYIGAAGAILASIWGIFKVIAKLTPNKKDDEVAAKYDSIVKSVVGDDEPEK